MRRLTAEDYAVDAVTAAKTLVVAGRFLDRINRIDRIKNGTEA